MIRLHVRHFLMVVINDALESTDSMHDFVSLCFVFCLLVCLFFLVLLSLSSPKASGRRGLHYRPMLFYTVEFKTRLATLLIDFDSTLFLCSVDNNNVEFVWPYRSNLYSTILSYGK